VPFGGPAYGLAYQQQLAAIRSIPPQVKNEWAKQARLGTVQPYYAPPPQVQVVYIPAPAPAVPSGLNQPPHNGGLIITAPPPTFVIPNSR
jgi:hypothetical protein